jgi:hypothetical protein
MLADYDFSDKLDDVRNMYDGYNFSGHEIYNPWSIIHCIDDKKLGFYWANSSDNALIKELCLNSGETVKRDVEILIENGSIKKPIDDNIVFADIKKEEALWSFMLMCGYLRYDNPLLDKTNYKTVAYLSIPNEEIMSIFVRDIIINWFSRPESTMELENLANQLVYGDIENFKTSFTEFCQSSFSYYDVSGREPEKFYHGFVLGLLACLKDKYRITSNREAGSGRYDIMLMPINPQAYSLTPPASGRGIIFDFKTLDTSKNQTFEKEIEKAKKQIIAKNYAQELISAGVKDIVNIIAVFEGKEVRIETF